MAQYKCLQINVSIRAMIIMWAISPTCPSWLILTLLPRSSWVYKCIFFPLWNTTLKITFQSEMLVFLDLSALLL